ncbi:hypothetical protein IAU60_006594 [Kwoniella sp. DSM 27419]
MAPRKSLPSRPAVSTPRSRPNTAQRSQSTVKRPRTARADTAGSSTSDQIQVSVSPLRSGKTRTAPLEANDTLSQIEVDLNGHEVEGSGEQVIVLENMGEAAEVDLEAELEAWQDFAHEHYEMVEQLPLELHRNFRLLRELDDGCQAQVGLLHTLVRQYATERISLCKKVAANSAEGHGPPILPVDEGPQIPDTAEQQDMEMQDTQDEPVPITAEDQEAARVALTEGVQETPGVPVSDGAGGLIIHVDPSTEGTADVEEAPRPRIAFPTAESTLEQLVEESESAPPEALVQAGSDAGGSAEGEIGADAVVEASAEVDQLGGEKAPESEVSDPTPSELPSRHLSEIARLAREMVRTAEEKVAVAVGAYNAIDRHIRALDSALTAQEASILLGLRPETLPSANVDESLNMAGDTGALGGYGGINGVSGDEGELAVATSASRSHKKKKGRKSIKADAEKEEEPAAFEQAYNIPADPNEPRYCYCNQVSFGQMVGCDNDECPIEWFHMACAGLQAEPTGKWWCNICRPKMGLGKGGAGKVPPKNVGTGSGARKKR